MLSLSVTTLIIVITVFLSLKGFKDTIFMEKWMFNPYKAYHRREYARFLTSGFIHKDWGHLAFNMFTLYFLGSGVEQYFAYFYGSMGAGYYILLYLTAIIVSSVPTYLRHKEHEFYYSLGASGGVSALVFAFILIDPITKLCFFVFLCLPGFILGALYIMYSIHMGKKQMDNINHDAHLYGALYGVLFMIVLSPGILVSFIEQLANWDLSLF